MKKVAIYFPAISSVLLEAGNIGQLWQMWSRRTAAGQNPWSYFSILAALLLWLLYFNYGEGRKLAFWATLSSFIMVAAILVTVVILQQ